MTICCLGDLVLDVIVRLEQPLATGADATSQIVLRPGGQAANVAAWVAALGGRSRFVGKRGADAAGDARGGAAARARASSSSARSSRTGTGSSSRSSTLPASGRCAPTAASRPSSARRRSTGVVRGLRPPPRLGLCAPARAGPVRRGRGDRRRARGRRPGEHRPLVVERDPRLRRGAVPRRARGARTRRRVRERGRGRDRRRPHRRLRLDPQAGRARAPRSTATSAQRSGSRRRRLDGGGRRASPPAGSWAGRSSRSRPRRAASQQAGSMPHAPSS